MVSDSMDRKMVQSEWLSSRTQTTSIGEDTGEGKEPFYTVGGNVN
jgi:hypothetical protein